MDGSSRAAAGKAHIELLGQTYWLTPLDLQQIGTIEKHILQTRVNPLVVVAELEGQVSDAVFARMMDQAYKDARKENRVTTEEIDRFLNTFDGMCMGIFLSIKPNHPDETLDSIKSKLEEAAMNDGGVIAKATEAAIDATGFSEMGNSTGSASAGQTLAQ